MIYLCHTLTTHFKLQISRHGCFLNDVLYVISNDKNECIKFCSCLKNRGRESSISKSINYIMLLYNITQYQIGINKQLQAP